MSHTSFTQVRYGPYPTRGVYPPAPIRPTPPTWALNNPSTEFAPWRGSMPSNQHPSPSYLAKPPASRPGGVQPQSHHQMRFQLSAGQAYAYQGTRRGCCRGQIPFNPHHGARPVNNTTVYPPHSGGPHVFPPGHGTPITYRPEVPCPSSADSQVAQIAHQWFTGWHSQMTQSLSAYAYQSNRQATAPPQQSPSQNKDFSKASSATIQPTLLATTMPVEEASSIDTSTREETESKEAIFAAEICPFTRCKAKCGRRQELKRHIRQHLPHYIYCEQEGCNWTGNRLYALRTHLAEKHSGAPVPEPESLTIYDAKGLVKRLLNKETSVGRAVSKAQSLFQEKAVRLGKNWRWMRGLKTTCAPTSLEV